jgi:hypothetical protein
VRLGSLLGVSLLLCVSAACQSEDREPASFCESYCARVVECSSASDRGPCLSYCDEYQATTPASTEFLQAGVPCLRGSSCSDVLSGDYYIHCYEEAVARTQPSDELIRSCEEIALRDFECGFSPDVGQCVEIYKIFKPTVPQAVLDCARLESCELVAACYEELFQ